MELNNLNFHSELQRMCETFGLHRRWDSTCSNLPGRAASLLATQDSSPQIPGAHLLAGRGAGLWSKDPSRCSLTFGSSKTEHWRRVSITVHSGIKPSCFSMGEKWLPGSAEGCLWGPARTPHAALTALDLFPSWSCPQALPFGQPGPAPSEAEACMPQGCGGPGRVRSHIGLSPDGLEPRWVVSHILRPIIGLIQKQI